jgi:hypothetical protein
MHVKRAATLEPRKEAAMQVTLRDGTNAGVMQVRSAMDIAIYVLGNPKRTEIVREIRQANDEHDLTTLSKTVLAEARLAYESFLSPIASDALIRILSCMLTPEKTGAVRIETPVPVNEDDPTSISLAKELWRKCSPVAQEKNIAYAESFAAWAEANISKGPPR